VAQVAGRTGRGELGGEVILQSYCPEHYAIRLACEQTFEAFYEKEDRFRRLMRYPPHAFLVNVVVAGKQRDRCEIDAALLAARLRDERQAGGFDVLGPQPAPISRIRDRYRYQIILRGGKRVLGKVLEGAAGRISPERIEVDVDPVSLM
jgi:primosomal protein N' (replication factor Y)